MFLFEHHLIDHLVRGVLKNRYNIFWLNLFHGKNIQDLLRTNGDMTISGKSDDQGCHRRGQTLGLNLFSYDREMLFYICEILIVDRLFDRIERGVYLLSVEASS